MPTMSMMAPTLGSATTSTVAPCKGLSLLAEVPEIRCTACFDWFLPIPPEAYDLKLPRSKPFFKRWAKRLARDHCPQCRQGMIDLALGNDKKVVATESQTDDPEAPLSMGEEFAKQQKHRRTAAAQDVKLYQCFIDDGANLPLLAKSQPAHLNGVDADTLLTKKQERALFRELQRRGAFRYVGMKEGFRDDFGAVLPDEDMYAIIKEGGNRWSSSHGWISKDGHLLSFVNPRMNREQESENRDGAVKQWDSKGLVSGRKVAPRMARKQFTLDSIEEAGEGEEVEAQVRWILETFIPSTTALLRFMETKPKNLSVAGRPARANSDVTFQKGMLHTFQSAIIRNPETVSPLQCLQSSNQGFFARIVRRMSQ